jgi:1-acyl-sn-glycerol-3-phosphate acyltransferase
MRAWLDGATAAYMAVAVTVKTQHALLGRTLHVAGLQHLPRTGPVIVACNHISYADPVILGMAVERAGRAVRYLAKRELFNSPFMGRVVRSTNQIPVDRNTGNAAASLLAAEAALKEGALVAIFPEGTIPKPDRPLPVPKTGAARLALATGAPLVPAAVWGGLQISGSPRRWLRPGARLAAHFGPAVEYSFADAPAQLLDRLMAQIRQLTTQAQRSVEVATLAEPA